MEISQERLEKFWKRWGFWLMDDDLWLADWYADKDLPTLTLDNLMKYAVPAAKVKQISLFIEDNECACLVGRDFIPTFEKPTRADTPALALFLALEKLKGDN